MNEQPRQILCQLIARFGPGLCDDPIRCEGLLRDLCGEHRREIFVLIAALKERVAAELRDTPPGSLQPPLYQRLVHRLVEHLALSEDAARWTVRTWALALGVVTADPLDATDVTAAPAPPVAVAPVPAVELTGKEPPSVATLVVSQLGRGHYTTISRALQTAPPGTRILVQPGRYLESLLLDRPVELVGDGPRGDVVIEASDADCVALLADYAVVRNLTLRARTQGPAQDHGSACFAADVARGRLVLEDCALTAQSHACIAVHGAKASAILRRCHIHDSGQAGILVYEQAEVLAEDCELTQNPLGLVIAGAARPTLRRCRIHGGKSGVYAYDGGSGLLDDCALSGHSVAAIQIRSGAAPTLHNCRVQGGQGFGVYVYEQGQGSFEGCDLAATTQAALVIAQGGSPTLRRCTIHDSSAEGIYVLAQGRGQFEDCTIFGHKNAGVAVLEGGSAALLRSVIRDNRSVGVYLADSAQVTLRECQLVRNAAAGIELRHSSALLRSCHIAQSATFGVVARSESAVRLEDCVLEGNPLGPCDSDASSRIDVEPARRP